MIGLNFVFLLIWIAASCTAESENKFRYLECTLFFKACKTQNIGFDNFCFIAINKARENKLPQKLVYTYLNTIEALCDYVYIISFFSKALCSLSSLPYDRLKDYLAVSNNSTEKARFESSIHNFMFLVPFKYQKDDQNLTGKDYVEIFAKISEHLSRKIENLKKNCDEMSKIEWYEDINKSEFIKFLHGQYTKIYSKFEDVFGIFSTSSSSYGKGLYFAVLHGVIEKFNQELILQ